MALKGLNEFNRFMIEDFLKDKRLVFIKAFSWSERGENIGCKIVTQIVEDETRYSREDLNNFGEQITIKVRGVAPVSYQKLRPFNTCVTVTDVEKATIWGDYNNNLSVTAVVKVLEGGSKQ